MKFFKDLSPSEDEPVLALLTEDDTTGQPIIEIIFVVESNEEGDLRSSLKFVYPDTVEGYTTARDMIPELEYSLVEKSIQTVRGALSPLGILDEEDNDEAVNSLVNALKPLGLNPVDKS